MGIRFAVGKLVELLYYEATVVDHGDNSSLDVSQMERHGIDFLRRTLGHPLKMSNSVRCVVASPNGMDSSSSAERFLVASRLWAEGISAEYLPQSGVMMSILKRIKEESIRDGSTSVSLCFFGCNRSPAGLLTFCSLLSFRLVRIGR